MPLVRILTLVFVLYAVGRGVSRFRRGLITIPELLIWCGLWTTVAVVVLIPATADWLARFFGVERGIDAAFYVAFIALAYAYFRLYLRWRGMEQQLTVLVRRLALEKAEGEKK